MRTFPEIPSALDRLDEIARLAAGKRVAVFLDYDGTLTPIVDRPELAVLSREMRKTIGDLARLCTVAIVSGRDRSDIERLVGLDSIFYAGSHGFDIEGPGGRRMQHPEGARYVPALRKAEEELRQGLRAIQGAIMEGKAFAVAVHFRLVAEGDLEALKEVVETVASNHPELRRTGGKKIYELRPDLDWDKGKAVLWLLEALDLNGPDVLNIYVGDDLTDEDAFRALQGRGIGILVASEPRSTHAQYVLPDTEAVRVFLEHLIATLGGKTG